MLEFFKIVNLFKRVKWFFNYILKKDVVLCIVFKNDGVIMTIKFSFNV